MRWRILGAMVVVTAIAIGIFATPLAIALGHLHRQEEVVRLERVAAEAAAQVPAAFPGSQDQVELASGTQERQIGLYDRNLRRVAGRGPRSGDGIVRSALRGDVRDREIGGRLVVGLPLSRGERVVGALRVSAPMSVVTDRTRSSLLIMGALGLFAVGASALLALWMSRRLARPVDRLARVASRLGDGDFTVRAEPSGMPEVDAVSHALESTAMRLDQMLGRERTFSEDASHQLRTPLTSLRVTLEAARLDPSADRDRTIDLALGEVDRLEQTIDDLLALGREAPTSETRTDLAPVLATFDDDWHGRSAVALRPLQVTADTDLPTVAVSARAIRQILDVLVENALRHGAGTITVRARSAPSGAVVEVADEGPGVVGDGGHIFDRRVSPAGGSGIGLALARSLAEAEGGRLLLARARPEPVFALVLPSSR